MSARVRPKRAYRRAHPEGTPAGVPGRFQTRTLERLALPTEAGT
jgi:hypothetical protein